MNTNIPSSTLKDYFQLSLNIIETEYKNWNFKEALVLINELMLKLKKYSNTASELNRTNTFKQYVLLELFIADL